MLALIVKPGHVLVANAYSVISAGPEKAAIELVRGVLVCTSTKGGGEERGRENGQHFSLRV